MGKQCKQILNINYRERLQKHKVPVSYITILPPDNIFTLDCNARKAIACLQTNDSTFMAQRVQGGTWVIRLMNDSEPITEIFFGLHREYCLWDSGASCCAISRFTLEILGSKGVSVEETFRYRGTLKGPSDENIVCRETVRLAFRVANSYYRDIFNVIEMNKPLLILGYLFMKNNQISIL